MTHMTAFELLNCINKAYPKGLYIPDILEDCEDHKTAISLEKQELLFRFDNDPDIFYITGKGIVAIQNVTIFKRPNQIIEPAVFYNEIYKRYSVNVIYKSWLWPWRLEVINTLINHTDGEMSQKDIAHLILCDKYKNFNWLSCWKPIAIIHEKGNSVYDPTEFSDFIWLMSLTKKQQFALTLWFMSQRSMLID